MVLWYLQFFPGLRSIASIMLTNRLVVSNLLWIVDYLSPPLACCGSRESGPALAQCQGLVAVSGREGIEWVGMHVVSRFLLIRLGV
jgi:hypothetical protein